MTPEEQTEHRAKAEREAGDDLAKTPRHLLNDIHDELIRFDRQPIERLSHAQKRLASLTVKNAEASDAVSSAAFTSQRKVEDMTNRLVVLTTSLERLTKVLLVFTIVATYPILKDIAGMLKSTFYPSKVVNDNHKLPESPDVSAKENDG